MFAVIRTRGSIGVNRDIRDALKMMRLNRVNHLVLLPKNESVKGTLKKVEPFVTYGEIDEQTLIELIENRARIAKNKNLSVEFFKKSPCKSAKDIAKAIIEGKNSCIKIGIKPVFRLHPPKKGFERGGIKKSYRNGGVSGYRAQDINALIRKMI